MVFSPSSCGSGCGFNSCETNLATSCKNPYLACPCPATSSIECLSITNLLGCSVRLCFTLSDSTTTSTIIPGSSTNVPVGPFYSGAAIPLTITFMEAVVVPVCGKLCPLYNNTLPQPMGVDGLDMTISSSGAISFAPGTCV